MSATTVQLPEIDSFPPSLLRRAMAGETVFFHHSGRDFDDAVFSVELARPTGDIPFIMDDEFAVGELRATKRNIHHFP